MLVLIAHLTDVHVKTESDPVLARGDQIARAIASEVTAETELVILALGGDSAYLGAPEQFAQARELYLRIQQTLSRERPGVLVQFVVVAGNHDCDFSACGTSAPGVVPLTLEPAQAVAALANYFEFTNTLPLSYTGHNNASPFFAWTDFMAGEGLLRFLLVNTSVFSQLHEQPGSLRIPVEQLSARIDPPAQYVVAVLHHPWNWFAQPDVMRPLRDRIEELSDVILTGHEHSPETLEVTRNESTRSLYISGGVLQDSDDSGNSSFLIIQLHPDDRTRSSVTFRLNKTGFYERVASHTPRSFRGNPVRIGRPFDLTDDFSAKLDDLGFLIHHGRNALSLSDIFVFPDLLIVDEPTTNCTKQVKSRDVAAKILGADRVLISGGEKSGKTCLAKSLFRAAYGAGRLPVLLNGASIQTRKATGIREAVRRTVKEQYQNLSPDQYEQLSRDLRVIILDDFSSMVDIPKLRSDILKELEGMFGAVVVIASEAYCFNAVHTQESTDLHLWQYVHFNILSFGEALREQFIRQWLSLAEAESAQDARQDVVKLTKVINGVIKKTLLPCYPLFLIMVLQQAEAGQPAVRGGSYGHLFEAVVTGLLNKSEFTKISISAKHRYLATLGFELHQKNVASLPDADVRVWHEAYWRDIGAKVDYDRLLKDLIDLNILQMVGGGVSFRYKYHYCFFVAYYLSENITSPAIRRVIRQLCKQLYHPETGDIFLFLSHLSNDALVLDEMLRTADELLKRSPEANFTSDVAKLNSLEFAAPPLALPDGTPDERRQRNLDDQDNQAEQRSSAYADGASLSARPLDSDAMVNEALELPAAYKVIQILGQYARNHADSTPVEVKERTIRTVFAVAKRIIGGFFDLLNEGMPEIAQELADGFRVKEPDIARDDLVKQIGRHVFGLAQLLCFVVTRHVSNSTAHELIQGVASEIASDLGDLPSQFFDLGISLEKPGFIDIGRLKKLNALSVDNPFAQTLVRLLVMHHMYLFNVNYKVKQAAAAELSFTPPRGAMNQDRKKLK